MGAPALARRCDVRAKYASRLHPSCGRVAGAPPGIWTFLSSLSESESFSILLVRVCALREPPERGVYLRESRRRLSGRVVWIMSSFRSLPAFSTLSRGYGLPPDGQHPRTAASFGLISFATTA